MADNTSSWMEFAQRPYDEGGLGLAKHQAAGIVGNLQNESGSGITPWGVSGDNGTAQGSAQWRLDRLDALKSMYPDTYQTPEAQQAFMRHELTTTHNGAYKALQAAQSPEEAARAFNSKYEISADTTGHRAASARMAFGSDVLPDKGGPSSYISPALAAIQKATHTVPALSPDNTMGTGALSAYGPPGVNDPAQQGTPPQDPWDRRAEGLSQIGAALAGIVNPQQAYAINQSILANRKTQTPKDAGTWHSTVLPNGQVMQTHSLTGQSRVLPGNYSKPAEADEPDKPFGDVTKTGDDYLATVDPSNQGLIKSIANGDLPPLSSYALAKPEGRRLMSAVTQYEPGFTAATWAERNKMAKDLGSSAPNSIGGIISNGKSAFDHLATTSEKLVDVGNTNSSDYPGAGMVNDLSNWAGNGMAGSKQKSKITAATDALQKYGAESTKFYAGTGGGVHERAEALRANDPASNSGDQSASYLETERDLMLGRLHEKEDQIRKSMGPAYLEKHPVRDDGFNATLDKINTNIEKLRNVGKQKDSPSAAAPSSDKRPSLDSIFN